MTLLDSLLDAVVRLEGDALVMHVGEKPYVVTTSAAMGPYRGPLAWGQVELSSRVLTSEAVLGMIGQILPADLRQALDDLGAIEHEVVPPAGSTDRFTVIAARGGDDVFLELRRRPQVEEPAAAQPLEEPAPADEGTHAAAEAELEQEAAHAPVVAEAVDAEPAATAVDSIEPGVLSAAEEDIPLEIVSEVEQESLTDADVNGLLAGSAAALLTAVPAETLVVEESAPPFAPAVEQSTDAGPAPSTEEAIEPEPAAEEFSSVLAAAASETAVGEVEPQGQPVASDMKVEAPEIPEQPVVETEIPAVSSVETQIASSVEEEPVTAPPAAIVEPEPEPIAEEAVRDREPRAIVVPLARPAVRSDAAAASSPPAAVSVEELLRAAAKRGASTVYVVAQSLLMARIDGEITALDVGSAAPLTESDVNRLLLDLAPAAARDAWQRGAATEWICDVADVGSVRCLTFHDHRGPGVIFRMVPPQANLADQLGLTADVRALCTQSDGLVIVTGARASGKSTLLNAFIDLINRTSSDHVITIESQIEFAHESRRSFVSQREVRGDSDAVISAVRGALREDPDVLLIEDLRSAEIASVAFEAAESGRLVFGSLPAASTVAAVNRLLEMFPHDRRAQAQGALARVLRGVIAQVLLRRSKGGRIAAREILVNTPPVAGLIDEGKTAQLARAMESGRRHGMMPLNDALASFVRDGTVHATEAYLKAFDKDGLLAALEREGGDTSFAERLA